MTNIKSWLIPFRVGGPIQEPAHFIGHKDDVEEIVHAMLGLQNISLRGERRTGKTSLLLYLAHPESEIQLPDNHIPVYFNLQDFAEASAVKVWQAIAEAIAERLEQQHPERMACAQQFLATIAEFITPSEEPPLFGTGFGRGLTELKGAGFKIHLLFDEFDQTVRNPELGDSFYDALRSLPTRAGNISYVIASRTGLSALQPTYNKVSSPLFNIFTTIVLKPLREDEVYRLIFSYFTQAGLDFFLAEKLCQAAPLLYETTGYHAFFLQALCYHLCARLDEPDWPEGVAKEEALRAFERDAKEHFEFYWRISTEEEQQLMRKLALGELIDWNRQRGLVQSLQDRCLIVGPEHDWQLFSSLFAPWINQQMIVDQIQNSNPFFARTPIRGKYFFGRHDLLREIFSYINRGQSVSLVGERRSGKTSILHRLLDLKEELLPKQHLLVFQDILGLSDYSQTDLWVVFLRTLSEEVASAGLETKNVTDAIKQLQSGAFRFETLFKPFATLLRDGYRVTFLFDEFEATASEENPVELSFYKLLRNLALDGQTKLSYVIATRLPLSDVERFVERKFTVRSSPFSNIFEQLIIRPFSLEEARQMITGLLNNTSLSLGTKLSFWLQRDFLLELSGFHPFFLQRACDKLFKHCVLPDGTFAAQVPKEEITEAFLASSIPHFEFYWEISSVKEQFLLRRLSSGQSTGQGRLSNVARELRDRCLVIQAGSGWRLFSSVFALWIHDYQIAPSDEHELPLRSAESYEFENREEELKEIFAFLEHEPYLHLYGASGVGKTTLIGELLGERYREHHIAYLDFREAKFEAEGQNVEQLWREVLRQFYKTSPPKEFSLSELLTYFSSKINQAPHYGVVVLDNIDQMAPEVRRQLRRQTLPALQEKIASPALYVRVIAISCRESISQGTRDEMAELSGMGQISFQPYPLAPFANVRHDLALYQGLLRQAVARWGKQPLDLSEAKRTDPHDSESNELLKGWANQLYDLTAGHPAAIEATLNYVGRETQFAEPDVFETQRQALCQHVLAPLVLAQVQASFPSQPEYQQAFRLLWTFRYLSKGIFRRLLTEVKGKVHWRALNTVVRAEDYEVGQTPLWEKLNDTPLLQPEIGTRFFSRQLTPIWRQLGNLILRLTNQALYQALHADARAVFDHFAFHNSAIDTTLRLHCFVEALYHLTQEASNPASAHSQMDLTQDMMQRLNDFFFLLKGHEQFSDSLHNLHELFSSDEELRTELERIGQTGTLQRLIRTIEPYIEKNVRGTTPFLRRDKNG